MSLVCPMKLCLGDTVATVSLSWGGAGDPSLLWRYELGKRRLTEIWGLHVIEMNHTLEGTDYLRNHPEKRAADLMQAFLDPSVKAVFSCIGGDDSILLLPFIDFDVISRNPKIFMGYSDSTITHLMCYKAGIRSYYGPSILAEFAENNRIFDYTTDAIRKVLFSDQIIGKIDAADLWTGEFMEWSQENQYTNKVMQKNHGYDFLQGEGIAFGHLFGGCMDVLEMAKDTTLWPSPKELDQAILFLETSEEMPDPSLFASWLSDYGKRGILGRLSGIIFGKPYQNHYAQAYRDEICKIAAIYCNPKMPIVFNASFGHNEPMCVLPYGAQMEINCEKMTLDIMESGVMGKY